MRFYGTEKRLGFTGALSVSVAVHVLLLSLTGLVKVTASPRLTFGPVYSVSLVSLPAGLLNAQPSSRLIGEVTAPASPPRGVVKRAAEMPKEIFIRKPSTPAGRPQEVEGALEALRQKTSTPAPTSETGVEGDSRMGGYYAHIWGRIKGAWVLPGDVPVDERSVAVVHARILRNGTVADVALAKSSGNAAFDRSALRALKKASPLPPLPTWWQGNSMEIGIRFHAAGVGRR